MSARPQKQPLKNSVKRSWDGIGWVAVDAAGKPISETFTLKGDAEAWSAAAQREADRKAKRGPRPCLCCGATFTSQGVHNRMCNPCRHRDAGDAPIRPALPSRRIG